MAANKIGTSTILSITLDCPDCLEEIAWYDEHGWQRTGSGYFVNGGNNTPRTPIVCLSCGTRVRLSAELVKHVRGE